MTLQPSLFQNPVTALVRFEPNSDDCLYSSSGIGWDGRHHCFWCFVEVERAWLTQQASLFAESR